jgi:uncharacterized protein (TIGR03083 family)
METPAEPVVVALAAQWAAIEKLLAGQPDEAWSIPTCLPGWQVRDIVAHLIGTECDLIGEQPPPAAVDVTALPHVRNDIAAANEQWVHALRPLPPADVLARFRDVTGQRERALAAMAQADFDAPSWTPSGQATYRRFMRIRVFDCWMHEQDLRDALGQPGNQDGPCAEIAIEESTLGLGFAIGKRAQAPQGSAVTIELTGPVARTAHVIVDGRAAVVPELPGPATATLRLGSGLFARLIGGRVAPEEHIDEIDLLGDLELGRRVAGNLAYTI